MRVCDTRTYDAPQARRRQWDQAVTSTYCPLDLGFRRASTFSGELDAWPLGDVLISHNVSDALVYRRRARHYVRETTESYLFTMPERSEVRFVQDGREARCGPGAFLVERSHLPFDCSYTEPNVLWVVRVPSAVLRARVGHPERLTALTFDTGRGVGALFRDMAHLTAKRADEMDATARNVAAGHLVDLLALAVEADDRVLGSATGSVRTAHLARAERHIRSHLGRSDLTPSHVADACGVSLRYLHQVFETQGTTVAAFIRRQRLLMCHETLRNPGCCASISEIAYRWGFSDAAVFSRAYRSAFGHTPRDTRAAARIR